MDLSAWSPIAAAWPGRADYTARELLTAAVVQGRQFRRLFSNLESASKSHLA